MKLTQAGRLPDSPWYIERMWSLVRRQHRQNKGSRGYDYAD
ncbi:hypothetical protein [Arsenicibacter rosenii]|nr:hypothetical protein [Arsenicibacter rosenii]